ncbi:hypothetical protein OR1_02930 [Geobacter sp. OR-1]|uniref:NEW3 domain-containing protein n=1 Tax=Geobacter sp. OR-1 TaxID=1266765 RepID=UPI000541A1D5|nr:NEW3 domain-containing protein [Geobacter sp. OR-1]GAM10641.1 hypothetical protein OR1_02930 [Geobacter sp. OR-1]
MKTKKIARTLIPAATLICLTMTQSAYSYQSPEAQNFMSGFNSFKNKDYRTAIKQLATLLEQPESQLRELALVFLARAYFKDGNTDESAYLLHLWKQEFPDSSLRTTLEQDLLRETAKIDIATILAKKEQERIARERAEQERLAAIKAEEERKAREMAEAERIAREKAAAERLANHKAAIYATVSTPKLLLSLPSNDLEAVAGKEMSVLLTVTNPGILPDSFALAAAFPSGWQAHFEVDGKQAEKTAEIAPGSSVSAMLRIKPPKTILEGQQLSLPIRLTSQIAGDRPISSEIAMVASAPIVRAVVKKVDSVDGDSARAQCQVSVLNVGSADASTLNIKLTHSASHVPEPAGSAPFSIVSGGAIKIGQLNLASGGLQEFLINFKVKDSNNKGISCKAELSLE